MSSQQRKGEKRKKTCAATDDEAGVNFEKGNQAYFLHFRRSRGDLYRKKQIQRDPQEEKKLRHHKVRVIEEWQRPIVIHDESTKLRRVEGERKAKGGDSVLGIRREVNGGSLAERLRPRETRQILSTPKRGLSLVIQGNLRQMGEKVQRFGPG